MSGDGHYPYGNSDWRMLCEYKCRFERQQTFGQLPFVAGKRGKMGKPKIHEI